MSDNQHYRYGSAEKATLQGLRQAGIIGNHSGAYFGMDETGRHDLQIPSDGSMAIFGGAGCGKSAGFFAPNLLAMAKRFACNGVCFDPRKELHSVSLLALSLAGYRVRCFDPKGVQGERTNPCDHLTINNPSVVADNRRAIGMILQAKGKKWWELDAQDWVVQLNLARIERYGKTSIPALYQDICNIQADLDAWCQTLDFMLSSRFPDVRRVAGAMMKAQEGGKDSFQAPLNTIYSAFAFMQDPDMAYALSGNDFSMSDVCDEDKPTFIFIVVPIQYIELFAPAVRALLGSSILAKQSQQGGKRIGFWIDEAGQLDFDELRRIYSFGRGEGMFAACSWQEISQAYQSLGEHGTNEILGSSQIRVFKGVRTLQTARLVSQMAGMSTLEFDPKLEQSNFERQKRQAVRKLISGSDVMALRHDLRHYAMGMDHQKKQPRQLITEAEVLEMPGSQMIAFASGLEVGPIFGHWPLYFEQQRFAGLYLPNPYHDPDRVQVKTRFGKKWAKVLEGPVPDKLAHLPQYQNEPFRYIKGYKPGSKTA